MVEVMVNERKGLENALRSFVEALRTFDVRTMKIYADDKAPVRDVKTFELEHFDVSPGVALRG